MSHSIWVIYITYLIWSSFLLSLVIIPFGLFELHKQYFHCKRMYLQNLSSISDLTSFYNQVFWTCLEDLPLQYRDNPSSVSLEWFYRCKILLLAEVINMHVEKPSSRSNEPLALIKMPDMRAYHRAPRTFSDSGPKYRPGQKSSTCHGLMSVFTSFVEPWLSIWVSRRPCWRFFLTKVKFSSISSRIYFLSFLFSSNSVWVFLIYRNIKSLNERIFWFEARSRAPQFD